MITVPSVRFELCKDGTPGIKVTPAVGRENTLSQMRELITQCYNHPSIVCWGLSNEITASGPANEDLLENHRQLNDL